MLLALDKPATKAEMTRLDYDFPYTVGVIEDCAVADAYMARIKFNVCESTLNASELWVLVTRFADGWEPTWHSYSHTSWKSNELTRYLTDALVQELMHIVLPYDPFDL